MGKACDFVKNRRYYESMKASSSPVAIVLRCGGSGTRLWPVSRASKPKQFQPILGEKSLFASKIEDIAPMVKDWRNVFVTTAASYVPMVRKIAPKIPRANIIAEPVRRNTGPGIALETAIIAKRYAGQDPIIITLTVDDVFRDRAAFRKLLETCAHVLQHRQPQAVVTIGCSVPLDTGLSYIVFEPKSMVQGQRFHRVQQWIEKPNRPRLKRLLKKNNIVAHTGLYAWRASTVLQLVEQHHPRDWANLQLIQQSFGTSRFATVLRKVYPKFNSVSVEEFLTKFAPEIVVSVADLHWRDTGKWFMVHDVRRAHEGANVLDGEIIALDTTDSLVYAPKGKIVAVLGVHDLIVVDTGDALLVCSKERSADVKQITDELTRRGLGGILQ